jgi:hypothetical protein
VPTGGVASFRVEVMATALSHPLPLPEVELRPLRREIMRDVSSPSGRYKSEPGGVLLLLLGKHVWHVRADHRVRVYDGASTPQRSPDMVTLMERI